MLDRLLYLSQRAQWAGWLFVNSDRILVLEDQEQAQRSSIPIKIAVDMLQNNSTCSDQEVAQYLETFDRVILINHETSPSILSRLPKIDLPGVVLLTVGCVHYQPKSMIILNHESFFGRVRDLYAKDSFVDLDDLKPYEIKPQCFDALLGAPKPHRDFIYESVKNTLIDKIYLRRQTGLEKSWQELGVHEWEWPEGVEILSQSNSAHWQSADEVRYRGIITNASNVIPKKIYNETAYSIVAESHTLNDYVFATEKTAKPLLTKRLAIWFAGSGHLAHLHRLGFRTFDGVIDERYDSIQDPEQRWKSAFEQVRRLCEIPQQEIFDQIKPVVEHNYRIMTETDWTRQADDLLISQVSSAESRLS